MNLHSLTCQILVVIVLSAKETASQSESLGLRLVGDSGGPKQCGVHSAGRLEVFHDGQWGTVCRDGWNHLNADVTCRTLQFDGYKRPYYPVDSDDDTMAASSTKIWLSDVSCSGYEDHFFNCTRERPWGEHICEHREDVALECELPEAPPVGTLPLRVFCPPGAAENLNCTPCGDAALGELSSCHDSVQVSGFVQAFYSGQWRFVDGSKWGDSEAFVFCGSIGYPKSFPNPSVESLLGCNDTTNTSCISSALKDELDNPIMYGTQCEGTESLLKDCCFAHWTSPALTPSWQPGRYATVQCGFGLGQSCPSNNKAPLQLRATPSLGMGRLELVGDRGWMTICGLGFDRKAANVACRQLGFGTAIDFDNGRFGSGSAGVSSSAYRCEGHEVYLTDCPRLPAAQDCSHVRDASVECRLPETCSSDPPRTRLFEANFNGRDYSYVQVYHNSRWGQACKAVLTDREGQVLCRQHRKAFFLGFGLAQSTGIAGPRYFGRLKCSGDELDTRQCSQSQYFWDIRRCSKSLETVIFCTRTLPDLVPSLYSLITSLRRHIALDRRRLSEIECAVEEKCLSPNAYRLSSSAFRYLLRFNSFIMNLGSADFLPYQPRSSWDWHACHNHYHSMANFVAYELIYADGVPAGGAARFEFLFSGGKAAVTGHKASFCLQDSECVLPGASAKFHCTSISAVQGISRGCGDLYDSTLDCQWLDVTDARRDTDYYLRLRVNPDRESKELDYLNNVVVCLITLTRQNTITVKSCQTL